MEIFLQNVKHALTISVFVFVMMLFIDYLSVMTRGSMEKLIGKGSLRQYVFTSLLGAAPGCLGSFMNVSFYVRGIISFGALTGGMLATSGDAAFVMLAEFPTDAMLLFGSLFVLGVFFAYLIDRIMPILNIQPCEDCRFAETHPREVCRLLGPREVFGQLRNLTLSRFLLLTLLVIALYGALSGLILGREWDWERITFTVLLLLAGVIVLSVPDHYLEEHIWNHIAKKHLWKIFLWSFGVLFLVDLGLHFWNLEDFVSKNMLWVLLASSLAGLVPEFGPQLVFVMMYAKGMVPFSVLLTSSIIQDGHGVIPLLSYSIRDSLLVKAFNLTIGLTLGILLFSLGY
jgi:hypothetical protein